MTTSKVSPGRTPQTKRSLVFFPEFLGAHLIPGGTRLLIYLSGQFSEQCGHFAKKHVSLVSLHYLLSKQEVLVVLVEKLQTFKSLVAHP